MLYCTQLIYIKEGQEEIFHQFEAIAIPLIPKYNGKLLMRLRPKENSIIESAMETPYEIHLVEFSSEQDFIDFMHDEERKKFLQLKERSIESSILIKGTKV